MPLLKPMAWYQHPTLRRHLRKSSEWATAGPEPPQGHRGRLPDLRAGQPGEEVGGALSRAAHTHGPHTPTTPRLPHRAGWLCCARRSATFTRRRSCPWTPGGPGQGRGAWAWHVCLPPTSGGLAQAMCPCVCMCVCMRLCPCVCMYVYACVHTHWQSLQGRRDVGFALRPGPVWSGRGVRGGTTVCGPWVCVSHL